jgi:hypothetical protein
MNKARFTRNLLVGAVASAAASSAFAFPFLKFSQIAAFQESTLAFTEPAASNIGITPGDVGAAVTDPDDAGFGGVSGFNWRGLNYDPVGPVGQSEIGITSFDSAASSALVGEFAGIEILGSTVNTSSEWVENEWWVIDRLTQINRSLEISGNAGDVPDPLWTVETIANFRVFDPDDNLLTSDLGSESTFTFEETFNSAGACGLNLPDSPFCTDVYRVSLDTFAPLAPFFIDGVEYTIDFTLVPGLAFDGLSDSGTEYGPTLVCLTTSAPGCADSDVEEGNINVYTPEFDPGESNIFVAARWRAAEPPTIPLPSGIALFGAGLLALGGFVRRKVSGKA